MNSRFFILAMLFASAWAWSEPLSAATAAVAEFNQKIRPVLEEYCYDCHGDGEKKGGVALDAFNTNTNFAEGRDIWWRVLKNLRANLIPPASPSAGSTAWNIKIRSATWWAWNLTRRANFRRTTPATVSTTSATS